MKEKFILFATVFSVVLSLLVISKQDNRPIAQIEQPRIEKPIESIPIQPTKPQTPNITKQIPEYLPYDQLVSQLQEWHSQATDLTEIGSIGKSTKGKEIAWIKVTNKFDKTTKKKVLITACIHGNEPLSTSTVMGYIGTMLANYGKDEQITKLIDTREIYFIPVLSPDSYPSSRHVDGVDPNRDFTNKRSAPVRAIQEFVIQQKFNAIISGHTYGRVYLSPWGDKNELCPNNEDFERIVGKMSQLSGYKKIRACQMYGTPIFGTEVDWYYRNGAFTTLPNGKKIHRGSFAIVMEFGTHQRIPSMQDIQTEFDRTFKAVLHFIEEAPKVEIWWDERGNPVQADGSPKFVVQRRAA